MTVSRDPRFLYWLCDCLTRFEGRLKMAGANEMIWVSRYKQQLDEELTKALVARWSLCTNIFDTCYGELDISLWDVY